MQQNFFQIFLSQEAGASGGNIEKELQKPWPKLREKTYIKFFHRMFALPAIQCKRQLFANMYLFCRATTQVFSL